MAFNFFEKKRLVIAAVLGLTVAGTWLAVPVVRSNEQKLVDLCFAIGLTLSETGGTDRDGKKLELYKLSVPEKAEWIAQQLAASGFPTAPCGSSWGILLSENPGLGEVD